MGFNASVDVKNAVKLRSDRAFQGLTVKMDNYCLARVAGADPSEAWRAAYDAEQCSPETISSHAAKLEADARIVLRIRQLRERQEAQLTLAPKITREWILNGVASIASNTEEKTGDRLKAYEMLGKSAGIDLFRDTIVTERKERTPEDVARELRAKLEALLPTIEGNSRELTPVDPPGQAQDSPQVPRKRKPIAS